MAAPVHIDVDFRAVQVADVFCKPAWHAEFSAQQRWHKVRNQALLPIVYGTEQDALDQAARAALDERKIEAAESWTPFPPVFN